MPVRVRIPTPLRKLTNNQDVVNVAGATVHEVLTNLDKQFPGVKGRLCDEKGQLRRFVNVYANGEDIRFLRGQATPLRDGEEIIIVPALAGG